MTFMAAVANTFRNAPKPEGGEKADRYGLLSPLLATGEYVTKTQELINILGPYTDTITGRTKPINTYVEKSVIAYNDYVKHLPSSQQNQERKQPFWSMIHTLELISNNVRSIEDNFSGLFGAVDTHHPEKTLKSSSLMVIGYLEKADTFCIWLSNFVEHLSADVHDLIPPFRTHELLGKATEMSEFAGLNLQKWNSTTDGLLGEIKSMQMKGSDLPIQATSGEWIDEFSHDSQFNTDEQTLITASLRNPMLIAIGWGHVKRQYKIELLSARKEWLTAKVIQEQSKLNHMDENSPEYRKLKKTVERYAALVSKYEQKVERMRG